MSPAGRFLSVLTIVLVASGCAVGERRGGDGTTGKRSGGTLRFAIGSAPATLDPGIMVQQNDIISTRPVFAGLTRLNVDGKLENDLAQSISTSKDGKVVTIRLRKGLRWSDGSKLTARDVVRTWTDNMERSGTVAPLVQLLDGGPDAITAVDDRTVTVRLVNPAPYFAQLLSLPYTWPLPPAAHEDPNWLEQRPLVASGPFVLASTKDKGGEIRYLHLKRNRHYWNRDRVDTNAIEVFVVKDPQGALPRVLSGKLDGASVLPDKTSIERLEDSGRLTVSTGHATLVLALREDGPLLRKREVREGISRAIDREALARNAESNAEPTIRLTAPGLNHAKEVRSAPGSPDPAKWHDKAEARRLFRAAGVTAKDRLRILAVYPHRPTTENAIAEQVEQAGLGVTVRLPPSPDDFVRIVAEGKDRNFDAFLVQTVSNYPDPYSMFSAWSCGLHVCDEEALTAMEEANATSDEEERIRRLGRVESMLTGPDSSFLIIPLYHPGDLIVWSERIKGDRPESLSYVYLDRLRLATDS